MTGQSRSKAELVRFVLGPDGDVVPDLAGSLPGRGAWVTADRRMLERASKAAAFNRAFEASAKVPTDLAGTVERCLVARCLDRLRLARRAGAVAVGAMAVERWLRAERVAILLVAPGTGNRRRDPASDEKPRVVTVLSAEELGSVFGWSNVARLAVAPGGFAEGIAVDLHRLAGFRDGVAQVM
ncbi:MAG: DUF448 domain-containing protein [Alphaproteobacteria bacterium]